STAVVAGTRGGGGVRRAARLRRRRVRRARGGPEGKPPRWGRGGGGKRGGGSPADEQGRPGRARLEEKRLAIRLRDVVREARVEEGERVVGDPTPPPESDAEGAELGGHPSDSDAEQQAPARQLLD